MIDMQDLIKICQATRAIGPISQDRDLVTLTYGCEFEYNSYENWDGVWTLTFPFIENFQKTSKGWQSYPGTVLKFKGTTLDSVTTQAAAAFAVAINDGFAIPWTLKSRDPSKPWLDGT